mgnify:CR=1 FL=1
MINVLIAEVNGKWLIVWIGRGGTSKDTKAITLEDSPHINIRARVSLVKGVWENRLTDRIEWVFEEEL